MRDTTLEDVVQDWVRRESERRHERLESALATAVSLQDFDHLERLHTARLDHHDYGAPASFWAIPDGFGWVIAGVPTYSELRAAHG